MSDDTSFDLKAMTSEIVSSYALGNKFSVAEIPGLIQGVFKALRGLNDEAPAAAPAEDYKATPAQIRKSIRPDALISFVDGKPYKTLKRHLATNGLSLADYKAKFGLPKNYPSTAPDYSAQRSEMAKSLGLGRKAEAVEAPPVKTRTPRKSGSVKVA
jgi:predicted transcriptional regulator